MRSGIDKETWCLDNALSKHILPRLIRFKQLTNGYPPDLKSMGAWKKILNKMIQSFTLLASDERVENKVKFPKCLEINFKTDFKTDENGNLYLPAPKKTPKQERAWKGYLKNREQLDNKIQEGLDLFAKYFRGLWW